MIRVLRPIDHDDIRGARVDKLIRESMEERGYTLGHSGSGIKMRYLEFDGASSDGEQRDFMNAILIDVLSMRIPNTFIEVQYVPEFSSPPDYLRSI
jgi:hypothetical protein